MSYIKLIQDISVVISQIFFIEINPYHHQLAVLLGQSLQSLQHTS